MARSWRAKSRLGPNSARLGSCPALVATCGLTRPQARPLQIARQSRCRTRLPLRPRPLRRRRRRRPSPKTCGYSAPAAASVGRTLDPKVVGLTGLGLSRPDIARLASLAPECFRSRNIVSKLRYYLPLLGSFHNFLRLLKHSSCLLFSDIDKVVKPNVVFLRECGLGDSDIAKLCIRVPRLLTTNPKHVGAMVACAERLGVPRGSGMLRQALQAVVFLSEDKIAARLEFLKNTFRWSDAEVSIAVCKAPMVLTISKESLKRRSEFLLSEVGLEPAYVAHRPINVCLSLEGRVRPRYYVVKFLKQSGLLDRHWSFYSAVMVTEKVFMEKFISPHNEAAPHLAEDYRAVWIEAWSCRAKNLVVDQALALLWMATK
ncbi:hypothetical protein VPH35_102569 [Triticum aestivum]